jgi:serine/threonine protein kinase
MGEVYRAHDPRTGRDVAVKISAERFSDRFSREVRAVAALNHPNICQLYDVGPNYLVMELVEGPTLAERISQGPVPLEEALAIAKQIAEARSIITRVELICRWRRTRRNMPTRNSLTVLAPIGCVQSIDAVWPRSGCANPAAGVMLYETAFTQSRKYLTNSLPLAGSD